ncbi:MAG TPA: hypothetical protein VKC61_00075 [Pyrinomonadaceae bacterium]|nr:hypothetical protein [Pyrinomonadaceae bacterium]
MSEVKLNLVDAGNTLVGTVHGSVADRCVAALSAEPETLSELASALARYNRPLHERGPFAAFQSSSEIDPTPWDAGLLVIDLASRIVLSDSTYSAPGLEGEVDYHDGTQATECSIPYRLPDAWLFVNSIEAYRWSSDRRRQARQATLPLDARAVLYGEPLLDFIVASTIDLSVDEKCNGASELLAHQISEIHARWLMTPRADLRGQCPREVILEKQNLIDFDLHTRALQWTFQGEGPPCLSRDSFAFRFAGFGTHEWVVYYDLARHLLWSAVDIDCRNRETAISMLEKMKTSWLESNCDDYDGRVPAIIIENERKRLPQAMSAKEMIIDENCEWCRMSAQDVGMGFGPGFWHLDGSQMDEGFVFSHFRTLAEWETEQKRWEEFTRKFEREQEEQKRGPAPVERVDADPF